jgi:hypothetical protein
MPSNKEILEQMLSEMPSQKGPRLSFPQMCGAFYALHRGFKRVLVAKAFGLSEASASLLANCQRAGTRHYKRVAEEFARLGEDAFCNAYFSDDILTRLQRIRMHVPEPTDIRIRLADNRAAKYQGKHWLENYQREPVQFEIAYRAVGDDLAADYETGEQTRPLPAGWAWRSNENWDHWSEARWRTSSEAYDGAHEGNGVASPRLAR